MWAPIPWLLLALLITALGLRQADRISLHNDEALLQNSLPNGNSPALPKHRLVQVTLGHQQHCPQLTWYENTWLTIRHSDGQLENRPGRSMHHFQNQLNEQLRDYPQCQTQHWVLYGRLTPQTLHFTLP